MVNTREIVLEIEQKVRQFHGADGTGHDWFHINRVRNMAMRIANTEPTADLFLVECSALLHDMGDHKLYDGDETKGLLFVENFLMECLSDKEMIGKIITIISEISFKGAGVSTPMSSIEGKIVQDADRLDAIGAIGIARTFAYGGSKNRIIYDPFIKAVCHTSFAAYKTSTAPTINHFYEKLLLLKDLMNTNEAKNIAESRHGFMEDFLNHFYTEWDGRD